MPTSTSKPAKPANGSRQSARASAADMEEQIEVLKAEIAKLSAQLQNSGERSIDALRALAEDGVQHVRARGEAAVSGLKDSAGEIETRLVSKVREKPVTSLAIAAGVGFLFALMSRR